MFKLDRKSEIYLYGAATFGKIITQKLNDRGFLISGYIDKRAEEIVEFCGKKVMNTKQLSECINYKDKIVIVVAVKNVFEHNNIIKQLIQEGFNQLLYMPYSILMGENNSEDMILNEAYNSLINVQLSEISLPQTNNSYVYQLKDFSIIKEYTTECIVRIPWQFLFTNISKEDKHIWANINCMQLFPHIEFFEYLSGNLNNSIEPYLDFCCEAARDTKDIEITEQWKQNVIQNRIDVFYNMNMNYELNYKFFIKNAPTAKWNPRGMFNLTSGKHRVAFLLSKGLKYIPVKIDKTDYTEWCNHKALHFLQDDFLKWEGRLSECSILHPVMMRFPFLNQDFNDNLNKTIIIFLSKLEQKYTNRIRLQNKKVLDISNDEGTLSRQLRRIGCEVTRFAKRDELVDLIDELSHVNGIKYFDDKDNQKKYKYIFYDMENEKRYNISIEKICLLAENGIFILCNDTQYKELELKHGVTIVFKGIKNNRNRTLLYFEEEVKCQN